MGNTFTKWNHQPTSDVSVGSIHKDSVVTKPTAQVRPIRKESCCEKFKVRHTPDESPSGQSSGEYQHISNDKNWRPTSKDANLDLQQTNCAKVDVPQVDLDGKYNNSLTDKQTIEKQKLPIDSCCVESTNFNNANEELPKSKDYIKTYRSTPLSFVYDKLCIESSEKPPMQEPTSHCWSSNKHADIYDRVWRNPQVLAGSDAINTKDILLSKHSVPGTTKRQPMQKPKCRSISLRKFTSTVYYNLLNGHRSKFGRFLTIDNKKYAGTHGNKFASMRGKKYAVRRRKKLWLSFIENQLSITPEHYDYSEVFSELKPKFSFGEKHNRSTIQSTNKLSHESKDTNPNQISPSTLSRQSTGDIKINDSKCDNGVDDMGDDNDNVVTFQAFDTPVIHDFIDKGAKGAKGNRGGSSKCGDYTDKQRQKKLNGLMKLDEQTIKEHASELLSCLMGKI